MLSYKKYYKARPIHASQFSSLFRYSNCVVPISVGQEYHTDEKFQAILSFVEHHFSSCTIVVADSLQRHTIMIKENCSEQDTMMLAKKAGEQWYAAHSTLIHSLSIEHKVRFWDEWLSSPIYPAQRKRTEALYHHKYHIQQAFNLTLMYFFQRLHQVNSDVLLDEQWIKAKILDYIIEECSIMPLWINENFHFEVYPAKRTAAMAAIYEELIQPYSSLLRWLRLKWLVILIKV